MRIYNGCDCIATETMHAKACHPADIQRSRFDAGAPHLQVAATDTEVAAK